MSIEITFVRHGETEANAASIWQGQGDAGLSALGRDQAMSLRGRLAAKRFDFALSSDLTRTLQTAELAGIEPVPDPVWREMDIGAWEGMTRQEVQKAFPDEIARLQAGDSDGAMGGGESWAGFSVRIDAAIADLVERTPAGSRVLVMAHGGVIHAALSGGLGFRGRRPWPVSRIRNAAVTEVITLEDEFQLRILNDVQHVPVVTGNEPGAPVTLIRHGESEANLAGRWHGRTDGPLTEKGRHQGADLAARYNGITLVFSSPLQRTRLTAEAFAAPLGLSVEFDDDLVEIDFGAWEGMTTSEIGESYPDEWAAVFADGVDLARGGTGETFAEAGARMERAVRRLVEDHPTERLALFTHGGAIWSLVSRIIGIDWSRWRRVGLPGNASLTHIRLEGGSPVLVDYNLPA